MTYFEVAASLILSNIVCRVIWHVLCLYLAVVFWLVELVLTVLVWLGCVRVGADGRPALLTDIDALAKRTHCLVAWDSLVDRVRGLTERKVTDDEDIAVRLSFPSDSSVASLHPDELIKNLINSFCNVVSVPEKRFSVYNSSPSPQQQTSLFQSAIRNQQSTAGVTSGKLAQLLCLGGKKSLPANSSSAQSSCRPDTKASNPVEVDVILRAAKFPGEPTSKELLEKLQEAFDGSLLSPPLDEVTSLGRIKPQHHLPVATNLQQQVRSPHSANGDSISENNKASTPGHGTQYHTPPRAESKDFESDFPETSAKKSGASVNNDSARGVGLWAESSERHDDFVSPHEYDLKSSELTPTGAGNESSEQKGADAELVYPKVTFVTTGKFSDAEHKQQAGDDSDTARLWFNFPHSEVDNEKFATVLSEELAKLLNVPKGRLEPSLLEPSSPRDHVVADLSFIDRRRDTASADADAESADADATADVSATVEDLVQLLRAHHFSKLDKKEFPLCSSIQQVGDQSMFDPPAGARIGFNFPYADTDRASFGNELAGDLASLLNVGKERIQTETVPCSNPLASVYSDVTFLGATEGTDEPTALSLLQSLRAHNREEAGLPESIAGVRSIEPFGSEIELDQSASGRLIFKIGYDDIDQDFLPTVTGQLAEFLQEPSRRLVASFAPRETTDDNVSDLDALRRVNGGSASSVHANLLIAGASGPNEKRAVEILDTVERADFSSATKPLSDVDCIERLELVDEPLLTRMGFAIGYGQTKDPKRFLAMLRGDLSALLGVDEKRLVAHLPAGSEERLAEKAKRDAKITELEEIVATIGDSGASNVRGMRAKADLVTIKAEAEAASKEELVAEVRFEAAQSRNERPNSTILAELESMSFAYCGSPILSKLKTLESSFGRREIDEDPLVARLNFEKTFAEIYPETFKKDMVEQIRATLKVPAERLEFLLPQIGGDIKPHHKIHATVRFLPTKNVQNPGVHELFKALRERRPHDMPMVTSVDYANPAAAHKTYGTLAEKKWKPHDLSKNKKPPRNFTYADARGGVLPLFKVDKGARERLHSQGVYKRSSMRRGKERVVGE